MGIFSDFVNNEKLKNNFRTIKPLESWGGIYPKGDPRWKGNGILKKYSRVPIKIKKVGN